jgi:hypothetical protein
MNNLAPYPRALGFAEAGHGAIGDIGPGDHRRAGTQADKQ